MRHETRPHRRNIIVNAVVGKCVIRAVIFLVIVGSATNLAADKESKAHKHSYELAFSAEEKVCTHFLRVFNEDARKYGRIMLNRSNEHQGIQWKKIDGAVSGSLIPTGIMYEKAHLDLNNDGEREYVVRETALLGGVPSDNLLVLNVDVTSSEEAGRIRAESGNNAVLATFSLTGSVYPLTKIKPYKFSSGQFKGQEFPFTVGGRFAIHLFKYQQSVWLSISERTTTTVPDSIDISDWHVIASYNSAFALQDTCYFKRTRN